MFLNFIYLYLVLLSINVFLLQSVFIICVRIYSLLYLLDLGFFPCNEGLFHQGLCSETKGATVSVRERCNKNSEDLNSFVSHKRRKATNCRKANNVVAMSVNA